MQMFLTAKYSLFCCELREKMALTRTFDSFIELTVSNSLWADVYSRYVVFNMRWSGRVVKSILECIVRHIRFTCKAGSLNVLLVMIITVENIVLHYWLLLGCWIAKASKIFLKRIKQYKGCYLNVKILITLFDTFEFLIEQYTLQRFVFLFWLLSKFEPFHSRTSCRSYQSGVW